MPQQTIDIPTKSSDSLLYSAETNAIVAAINNNAIDTDDQLQSKVKTIELNAENPNTLGFAAPMGRIGKGLDGSRWIKTTSSDAGWEKIYLSEDGEFKNKISLISQYGEILQNKEVGFVGTNLALGNGVKENGNQINLRIGEGDKYVFGDFVFEGNANGDGVLIAKPADSAGPLEIPYTWFPVKIDLGLFAGYTNTTGLHIPLSVREIGDSAFNFCIGISGELKIPDSVTKIGQSSFGSCWSITSLQLSNNIKEIGNSSFVGCSALAGNLSLAEGVEVIGESAFENIAFVGSLSLPDSLVDLGSRAFHDCSSFTGTLTLSKGLTIIKNQSFTNCGFTGTLTIPENVTEIENAAFLGCSNLTSLDSFPPSCTFIASTAFRNCSGLSGVFYQYHPIGHGPNAFEGVGFDTMYWVDSGTSFSNSLVLSNCPNLKDIYLNCDKNYFKYDTISSSPVERIHLRPAPHTPDGWTIGPGQTIGGVSGVEVVADWTNWPEQQN